METLRMYAACLLDLQAARRISTLSAGLRRAARERGWDADFVSPTALHLTLAVLDDVDLGLVNPVADALAQTALAHRPLRVQLAGVRAGGDPEAPRFLSVGIAQGSEALEALADELSRRLDALGLSLPAQPPPRLLLARVRRAATPLSELLRGADELGACAVSEVAIYRGDQARPDVEPPTLARFPLGPSRGVGDKDR